jgi:hypothetical protein
MALGNFHATAVQHVERGEHFHAVVMPANVSQVKFKDIRYRLASYAQGCAEPL